MRLPILCVALLLGLSLPATAGQAPAGPTDEQLTEQIQALNDLTTTDTMNAKLKAINKKPDVAKRMAKIGAKMQAVPGKPPLKFNAALVLANLGRVQKEFESSEVLYGWCLDQAYRTKSVDRIGLTFPGYVQALTARKKYAAIEEAAQRVLDTRELGEEDNTRLLMVAIQEVAIANLIQAKAKQGEFNAALDRVEQLIAIDKDRPRLDYLELKASVLREAGRHDEVVSAYQEMIKAVDKADRIPAELKEEVKQTFRYNMTSAYMDAKKVNKAIETLRELVKEAPEEASYANDLGFILADNDKELDEAEKLIRKAVELDEEQRTKAQPSDEDDEDAKPRGPNAAYLDSLGWVLFKQKKYTEALTYLERAAKDSGEGNHIEIWDHVADTQLALGRAQAAIQTWEKALKFENVSPRDADRRKAVEAKLKKAKANPPVAKEGEDK